MIRDSRPSAYYFACPTSCYAAPSCLICCNHSAEPTSIPLSGRTWRIRWSTTALRYMNCSSKRWQPGRSVMASRQSS